MTPEIYENFLLFLSFFMGFFAIMNPLAIAPVFLSLTQGFSPTEKKYIAFKAALTSFLIVFSFSLLGELFFKLFGISLDGFRVAGGLLLTLIGFNMLQGENSKIQHIDKSDQKTAKESALDIAISPLAIPILAGPGTITTAISITAHQGVKQHILSALALLLITVLNYLAFVLSKSIVNFLGHSGIKVFTRLMGLVLAVIGIQMLVAGILALVKTSL